MPGAGLAVLDTQRRHSRQPLHPRSAGQPHQHRLGLVVAGMAEHGRHAGRRGPSADQRQTRLAGLRLQVARTVPAPVQNLVPHAQPGRLRGDQRGLAACVGTQAVIDRHRADPQAHRPRPARGEVQQRHRITAARGGDDKAGREIRAEQTPHLGGEAVGHRAAPEAPRRGLCGGPAQRQPNCARAVWAAPASALAGNRASTSASARQASSVWPRRSSDVPRLSSADGARGPSGAAEKALR